MTGGETQLRARRTRIKILRAIADRNGLAGFSDIKTSTGLSTGSIYYHLERMGSYVTKDSKHYIITEEGLQFLRELDHKYTGVAPSSPKEEQTRYQDQKRSEEPARQVRQFGSRQLVIAGMILSIGSLVVIGLLTNWQALTIFEGISAGVAAPFAVVAVVLASLLVLVKRSFQVVGYKGTVFSALVLGLVLASVIMFSNTGLTGASPAKPYDNSMDALLSSYSMHWHIR